MKILFKTGKPADIVAGIKAQLSGRKLGDIVQFELAGNDLRVTIQKMGTSYLEFTHSSSQGGLSWELSKEKIALAHKAFKSEVLEKIKKIIDQAGGQMLS